MDSSLYFKIYFEALANIAQRLHDPSAFDLPMPHAEYYFQNVAEYGHGTYELLDRHARKVRETEPGSMYETFARNSAIIYYSTVLAREMDEVEDYITPQDPKAPSPNLSQTFTAISGDVIPGDLYHAMSSYATFFTEALRKADGHVRLSHHYGNMEKKIIQRFAERVRDKSLLNRFKDWAILDMPNRRMLLRDLTLDMYKAVQEACPYLQNIEPPQIKFKDLQENFGAEYRHDPAPRGQIIISNNLLSYPTPYIPITCCGHEILHAVDFRLISTFPPELESDSITLTALASRLFSLPRDIYKDYLYQTDALEKHRIEGLFARPLVTPLKRRAALQSFSKSLQAGLSFD